MQHEPKVKHSSTIFVLVSKIDPSSQPVLFFPYPASVQLERPCPTGYEVREVPADESGVRLSFAATKRFMYNAISNALKATNVRKTAFGNTWSLYWGEHLKAQEFTALLPFQRVNHFPGSFELGRKDRLCTHLLRMRKKHPTTYGDVIPETYLTANEYDKQQFLSRFHAEPHVVWILKPPNLSCGRGIKLVSASTHSAPKLSKKKGYVAQRYVANPFLINGLKFDLRVYVAVTSYDPLRVYLFNDGLVRFCTEKYSTSKSALQNPFSHLTNYSINKKNSAAFQKNNDDAQADDARALSSSKWSLQMLFKYLRDQGKVRELENFQEALEDLIIKTLVAVEDKVASVARGTSRRNGFELYGFDVLLEGEIMKPRLLEVNVFPSLSSSSPMDKRIKTVLISDLFQLVGIPFVDARRAVQELDKAKQDRLHGIKPLRPPGSTANSTLFQKRKETQRRRRTFDDLLQNLTCSALLSQIEGENLELVKEMEEEHHRQGHFKRIFPTPESFDTYAPLFDTLRYRNVLCMRWLQHMNQDGARRWPLAGGKR